MPPRPSFLRLLRRPPAPRRLSTSAPVRETQKNPWDYMTRDSTHQQASRHEEQQALSLEPIEEWLGGSIEQLPGDQFRSSRKKRPSSSSSSSSTSTDDQTTTALSLPASETPRKPAKEWYRILDGYEGMLILETGSKSTLPSEFYRLAQNPSSSPSPLSWSMMRVLQARRPSTLEPLPVYYLLFPDRSAARAYRDAVARLVRAGHADAPCAFLPPGRASVVMDLRRTKEHIKTHLAQRVQEPVCVAALAETPGLVAVRTQPKMSLDHMGKWLDRDGEKRNQYWRLDTSWGLAGIALTVDGAEPIMPEIAEKNSTFFLGFQTREEAQRFVQHWNGRRGIHFPPPDEPHRPRIVVDAYLVS